MVCRSYYGFYKQIHVRFNCTLAQLEFTVDLCKPDLLTSRERNISMQSNQLKFDCVFRTGLNYQFALFAITWSSICGSICNEKLQLKVLGTG